MAVSTLNVLDVIVIIILSLSIFKGYRKGLIQSIFGLFSFIIALLITNILYPHVAKFLRDSKLYDSLKGFLSTFLNIPSVQEQTLRAQTDLISSLPMTGFFKSLLISNNNPELYDILNVNGVEDYIISYIAALLINMISMVSVFVIVFVLLKIIASSMKVFNNIPIIKHFNRLGGACMGFFIGILSIWIIFVIMTFFFIKPPFYDFLNLVTSSKIAFILYEHNIILNMIRDINFYP